MITKEIRYGCPCAYISVKHCVYEDIPYELTFEDGKIISARLLNDDGE